MRFQMRVSVLNARLDRVSAGLPPIKALIVMDKPSLKSTTYPKTRLAHAFIH
jgi:hypothetical protein